MYNLIITCIMMKVDTLKSFIAVTAAFLIGFVTTYDSFIFFDNYTYNEPLLKEFILVNEFLLSFLVGWFSTNKELRYLYIFLFLAITVAANIAHPPLIIFAVYAGWHIKNNILLLK